MYTASETRYEEMRYNRCGNSGLLLPAVSLGLWHNFGTNGNFDTMQAMCHTAFDNGIPILIWLTIMALCPVRRKKISGGF